MIDEYKSFLEHENNTLRFENERSEEKIRQLERRIIKLENEKRTSLSKLKFELYNRLLITKKCGFLKGTNEKLLDVLGEEKR